MVERIELSPSDKARCKKCGKFIGKGTPRGITSYYHNNHTEYNYFCYKCTPKIITEQINYLKELQRKMKKLIKENASAVVLGELKNENK